MRKPELALQTQVARYLSWCLPEDILWTASMTGQNLSIRQATKNKAAGVKRGWPDLSFLFPDGVTRFIEMKTATGSLTPEQRRFRDHCAGFGNFAVCRSVEDVESTLRAWGAKMKNHPFKLDQATE